MKNPPAISKRLLTQRLQTAEAKTMLSFYKTLLDTITEGALLIKGSMGTIVTGNSVAWQILGKDEAALLGKDILSLNWEIVNEAGSMLLPDDYPAAVTLRSGKAVKNQVAGIKRSLGKVTWLRVNSTPLKSDDTIPGSYAVVTFSDITHEKESELKAIIAAQDHERDELSKELHDNVNQILTSSSLILDYAFEHPEEQREEYLAKGRKYIEMAIEEIRRISRNLNTSSIKGSGLRQRIEELICTLALGHHFTISFNYEDSLDQELSGDLKLALYRIIQEQTNNIVKYAKATQVTITIRKTGDCISMVTCDNGKGFDLKTPKKGIGLANMQTRVEAFNGSFKINTAPDKGCYINIMLPLKGAC